MGQVIATTAPLGVAFPRIVCLCGSTQFPEAFERAMFDETVAGRIVLSVGDPRVRSQLDRLQRISGLGVKAALDELHLRKIDLAGEVLVLNVGGYIGLSTRREVWYARQRNKLFRWLEPVRAPEYSDEARALYRPLQRSGAVLDDAHDLMDYIDSWFDGWDAWKAAGAEAAAQFEQGR